MNRDYIEVQQGVPGVAGSVWLASNAEEYPTLEGEQTADVVVVGGGITGALVARKLSGDGRSVILLDRRRIASGTTGHSTAKVTALHGDTRGVERPDLRRQPRRVPILHRIQIADPKPAGW